MVENRIKPPGRRGPAPSPEETWIKTFLEFSGTDNVTRVYRADLRGVSLTRAVEAICRGEMVRSEKCEGSGALCTFRHESDDATVEAEVFFSAGEMVLEIRGAEVVTEDDSEPDAA
jgi:hypothetical protein